MNYMKSAIEDINRSSKEFARLKAKFQEIIDNYPKVYPEPIYMLNRILDILEDNRVLYFEHPDDQIDLNFLYNDVQVTLSLTVKDDSIFYYVEYPFLVQFRAMPLVSLYLHELTEDHPVTFHLRRDGRLVVFKEYVFTNTECFNEYDFWSYMKTVVEISAEKSPILEDMAHGIVPEKEKIYCKMIFEEALATVSEEYKSMIEEDYGLMSTFISIIENEGDVAMQDKKTLNMFKSIELTDKPDTSIEIKDGRIIKNTDIVGPEDGLIYEFHEKTEDSFESFVPDIITDLERKRDDIHRVELNKDSFTIFSSEFGKANHYAIDAAYLRSLWVDVYDPNNLAYLSRRNENIVREEKFSPVDVTNLFDTKLKNRDTFTLINLALLWCFPTKYTDWDFAMKLIRSIDPNKLSDAVRWWAYLADKGDAEAHLVLLLLKAQHLIDLFDYYGFIENQKICLEAGYKLPLKKTELYGDVFYYINDKYIK